MSSGHSSSLYHVLMTVPVAHSPMLHSIRSPTSYITRHSASYAAQYEALPCAHFARGEPYEGIHAEAQTETAPGTVTRREEPRETRACGKHTHTHTHTHTHAHTRARAQPECPAAPPLTHSYTQATPPPRLLTKRRPSPASIAALSAALYAIACHSSPFSARNATPEMRHPTDWRWPSRVFRTGAYGKHEFQYWRPERQQRGGGGTVPWILQWVL